MRSSTTYAVVVKDGSSLLYAMDGSGEMWSPTLVDSLSESDRDGAIQAAVDASAPYDVIAFQQDIDDTGRRTLHPARRIGGTSHLIRAEG